MKTLIQFLLATFTILACVCCKTAKEEKTDDKLNEITFADPTIFVENGKYYLTGTRNREPKWICYIRIYRFEGMEDC